MRMFFYGTLKRGYYNNPRLRLDDPDVATFIGNATLDDYGIIMDGTLPYAVKATGNKLVGEVFDVHDENIVNAIERMEVGAGYEGIEVKVDSLDTESTYNAMFYIGRHTAGTNDKVLSKYDHPDARV